MAEWVTHVEQMLEPLHLDLEPLGERDTVEMVQSILASPDADFAQWVFDETRGAEARTVLIEARHPVAAYLRRWML